LKCIVEKFKEAENEDNNNSMYIPRMREMGVRKGEGRQNIVKGKNFTINR
jgi:hypothetical protein